MEINEHLKRVISNTKISVERDPKYSKGFSNWHQHVRYILSHNEQQLVSINISDNLGGCGIQQLFQWADNGSQKEFKYWDELLKYILKDLHEGVGLVMCQVGSSFYNSNFTKALENNGFIYHDEYINHQHGNGDTGRMYMKYIKK